MGMSVIKDNVASWRSKFIGKALSGYGVVMALNIFFIIVRVLLRVEIQLTSFTIEDGSISTSSSALFFDPVTMTLLLKGVFVLSGCVMIEKFAGELGTYFGAEDGLATGKALANEVGKEATKGVKLAAQAAMVVGTGGAGGALMAAKGAMGAVGGVASKIGKPMLGMAKNTVGGFKTFGQNVATVFTGGKSQEERQAMRASRAKIGDQKKKIADVAAHPENLRQGVTQEGSIRAHKGHITRAKRTMKAIRSAHKGERFGAIMDSTAIGAAVHRVGSGIGSGVTKLWSKIKGKDKSAATTDDAPVVGVPDEAKPIAANVQQQDDADSKAIANNSSSPSSTAAPGKGKDKATDQSSESDSGSSSSKSKGDTSVQSTPNGGVNINTSGDVSVGGKKVTKDDDKKDDKKDDTKERKLEEDRKAYNQEAATQMGASWMRSLLSKTPLQGIVDADKEWHEGAKQGLSASDDGKQILANIQKADQDEAEKKLNDRHSEYIAKRNKEMMEELGNAISNEIKNMTTALEHELSELTKIITELDNPTGKYSKLDDSVRDGLRLQTQQKIEEINGKLKLEINPSEVASAIQDAIKSGGDVKAIQDAIAKQFKDLGQKGQDELLKQIAEVIQKTMQNLGQ